jgi:hypothetical protein
VAELQVSASAAASAVTDEVWFRSYLYNMLIAGSAERKSQPGRKYAMAYWSPENSLQQVFVTLAV